MHAGGVAPMRGGDSSVDSPGWQKKTADAGSSRVLAAVSQPHGNDAVPPKPATKRAMEGPAVGGKTTAKKVLPAIPALSARQGIPTAIR